MTEADKPEFRVTMQVRNARLIGLREELGLTQKQLEKAIGCSSVGQLELMHDSPVAANGEWRKVAKALASFFDTTPSWLFPDAVVAFDQPGAMSRDVSTQDLRHLQAVEAARLSLPGPGDQLDENETKEVLRKVLSLLTPREEYVIRHRYGFAGDVRTLVKIAEDLEVTNDRVRQIQVRAERKLRQSGSLKRYLRGVTLGNEE